MINPGLAGILAGVFALGAVASAQTTSTIESNAAKKPNILMILSDDMGYGEVSAYYDKLKVKTPNIDRLAKEGIKFTQFYVAMPICSPSRAAILSSTFSPENQLTSYLQTRKGNVEADQNDYMDPARAWFPKTFKAAGYATAHVGKWHLGGGRDVDNAPSILEYGYYEAYSTWESPNRDPKLGLQHAPWDRRKVPGQVERYERTAYMVDRTLDFMERNRDKPTFVTLWADDMHTPFWPSPEMIEKHNGDPDAFESLENFYGVLEQYDADMGRLLDELKKRGFEDNTIVIFTSDNGAAPVYANQLRNGGLRGKKTSLYEGGIRVPFLVRWPGHIPAGKVDEKTVMSTVDLLPSLAKLAGIELTSEVARVTDGEDLSGALLGTPQERTKPLMWEYGRTDSVPRPRPGHRDRSPRFAIREGNYKVMVSPNGKRKEMFDIVNDPYETTNIADKHTTLVETLSKKVLDWGKTLPGRTHPVPENL